MKTYVINLAERADRLTTFRDGYPEGILPPFTVWPAKRGVDVTPPAWWATTANRWALITNVTDILAENEDGDEDVMICEDDCCFAENFREAYTAFMAEVPDDADMLFIGGGHNSQFLYPPVQVSENVLRCRYSLYNHCFIVKAGFIPTLKAWLLDTTSAWVCFHAQDNRIAELMKDTAGCTAYSPIRFLAGQRGGTISDLGDGARPADSYFNAFRYIDLEGNRTATPELLEV